MCVLTWADDEQKLKPLLIFKHKTQNKDNFPNVVVVSVNEQ